MIQTLDLPVLSLAIPNIHKLNNINADNLSCMWTVFSKCKDNLENGRRLENMSWRLWYRESSLKESDHINTPLSATCPIPIQQQQQQRASTMSGKDDKHLSPASFKRIISSLNENEIKQPMKQEFKEAEPEQKSNMIMFEKPNFQPQQTQQSKFFIKEDEESDLDYEDEDGWSSDEDEEVDPTPTNITPINIQKSKKFAVDYSEDEDDQYEDINEDDEDAFLSEFRKRSPPPINGTTIKKNSLLSNLFRSQGLTRLVNQSITASVTQQQQQEDELLSTSMKKCIELERQQFGHDFILKKKCDSNHDSFMLENNINSLRDNTRGLYW